MDDSQMKGAESPANTEGTDAPLKHRKLPFWRRRTVIVIGTVALAGLFFLGLHFVAEGFTHESTDDAFLSGNIVALAPKIAGQVGKVCVNDNQRVKAGDVLVEIDPRDFEIQVAQKNAALAAAEANVKLIESSIAFLATQVATAEATVKQSEAEAAANEATAGKANADLIRAEGLIQNKTISAQEYDAVKAAATAAGATLKAGQEKVATDRAKIASNQAELESGRRAWERAQAQARQSGVDVDQARLNHSYARVIAPQDGWVTRKAVEAGDYVQVGQRLMALVPDAIWVVGNFKETQLKNIRPGQTVEISVDSVAGRMFAGHVDSIQAGTGAAFSLLPPENAVGNYVKIVQRVPVKIVFDKPVEAGHVLGPGMSVVPSVKVADFEVPDFAVGIVAAILGFVAGYFWWQAANRKAGA